MVATCEGRFCPWNGTVVPWGANVWPLPVATKCTITSFSQPAAQNIAGGSDKTYTFGTVSSSTPGCGPCTNGDGRCANLTVSVSTQAQGEPFWQTWDKDSSNLVVNGLVK